MSDTASDEFLQPLRDAIVNKSPYISGTLPLSPDDFRLHYLDQGTPRLRSYIDFTDASEEQLVALASACQSASFGINQSDVLDESYRKAGELDASQFSTPIVPERTELITFIREELLDDEDSPRPVKVELYKLNVYGVDSFFKAHQDTPRSESMFGSLVLVFPTQHEGGALVLRHHGKEWMFDSAQAVKNQPSPTIGFIAFFSDVEHEVYRVTAGYRFTLTYNLYYDDLSPITSDSVGASSNAATLASFKAAFSDLLLNREFLPSGGLVSFALEHAYPLDNSNNLEHIPGILKGSDAMVWRACDDLDLEPEIFVVYGEPGEHNWRVLMDRVGGWDTSYVEGGFIELLTEWEGAIVIEKLEKVHGIGWDDTKDVTPVSWVVAPEVTRTRVKTQYAAYGNEASVGCTYGEGCMMVNVPALEVREARAEMASSTG